MKLLSIAVPSYNSQAYLSKCVESLLVGGEEVEILIVNDGSTDGTAKIADEYQAKYPTIVRAIHKPNGGHGSGVNKGIEEASGLYYKVVDSDDWVDAEAYKRLLSTLREHVEKGEGADMYITNFVYERVTDNSQYVMEYTKQFPQERFFTWNESKPLRLWKLLLMHALVYRTEMLRECGVKLPEHTFYVDNLYAYYPMPHCKKLYYLPVDFYRYYIGRSDQSVTIENIVKRYDQQIRVMTCMLEAYRYEFIAKQDKKLKKMMMHVLHDIMMNTCFFTTAQDTPERRRLYHEMWANLKARDPKMYKKMKYSPLMNLLNPLPWRGKGAVTTFSYKFLCKHVKLGV